MEQQAHRLLIVEDDLLTRQLLSDLCQAAGYHVTTVGDGEAGLQAARSGEHDLVLLDLMLPSRDGFGVLEQLRADPGTRTLPVIILSAMSDLDGKLRGMELGADDWLAKPFKLAELKARIRSALQVRDSRLRLQAAEEELARLRAVDPLTGVGTWSQLKVSLDGELARARRHQRQVAVLMVSVEGFGDARYHHPAATTAFLKSWSAAVQEQLRGADRLFRIEPDAFVALLPESDLEGAHRAAHRIQALTDRMLAEGRTNGRAPLDLQVIIAGAAFPNPRVHTSEDLLREAARSYANLREQHPTGTVFRL
ncbi:MAG TPA: response regulator [Myxococcaceae bacterium]|nr:response regulator [Myxococcaceae bacterium]